MNKYLGTCIFNGEKKKNPQKKNPKPRELGLSFLISA